MHMKRLPGATLSMVKISVLELATYVGIVLCICIVSICSEVSEKT